MVTKRFILVLLLLLIVVLILLLGIAYMRSSMSVQASTPVAVTEFHRQAYSNESESRPLFVVTWFSVPYSNMLEVIRIRGNDLSYSHESPNFARIPGYAVTLDGSDITRLNELTKLISDAKSTYSLGSRYLFTVSFSTGSGYYIFSCGETNCPSTLCTIFEIEDRLVRQQIPTSSGVKCPF